MHVLRTVSDERREGKERILGSEPQYLEIDPIVDSQGGDRVGSRASREESLSRLSEGFTVLCVMELGKPWVGKCAGNWGLNIHS